MARIVFTLEDGVEIESELDADVITIGRHPDSVIVLSSGSVSSHHATIKRKGTDFYVQDLGTTNGTKLNGADVEEAKLDHGDKVTVGDVHGIVHLKEAAPAVQLKEPAPAADPRIAMPTPDIVPPGAPPIPAMALSRKKRITAQKKAKLGQYRESTGCASFLMFLVLMVVAFVIGLHVRHGVETGGFLLQDISKKISERASVHLEQAPATGTPEAEPESESDSEKNGKKGKRMPFPPLQAPPSNN